MENTVATIDENKLAAKEADALTYATALVIDNNDKYLQADKFCVTLKGLENEIKSDFKASKEAAHEAHAKICAQEKGHLDKVVPPRNMIKQKMSAWQDEQERLRQEEENRLRIEAQKVADAEALLRAEQAQAEGNHEEAEAIIQEPVYVAPVIVPKSIPKTSTGIQKRWTFRVTDEKLVPRAYLMINESALLKQAQSTHNSLPVAGVEFYQKSV